MELPSRRLWQGSLCPYPIFFSGLAKKLFTNRLVSAIIIPLSRVRAGGSMDRASDSGSEGWGFESLLAYQWSAKRTLRRPKYLWLAQCSF